MGRAVFMLEYGQYAANDLGLCGSPFFGYTRHESFESSR